MNDKSKNKIPKYPGNYIEDTGKIVDWLNKEQKKMQDNQDINPKEEYAKEIGDWFPQPTYEEWLEISLIHCEKARVAECKDHEITRQNHASCIERLYYAEKKWVEDGQYYRAKLAGLEDAIEEVSMFFENDLDGKLGENVLKKAIQKSRDRIKKNG